MRVKLQSPKGARIVAECNYNNVYIGIVTVPERGANCSRLLPKELSGCIVTVPARGANCSKIESERAHEIMLQSPQGARIVATIMPECSAKGIYFPVIFTRYSISYFIL